MKQDRGKLIRSCLLGDKKSCAALSLTIFGSARFALAGADPSDDDHPNKMPFTGTLLQLDEPSTKPPHGSRGHRILVPTSSARKRVKGLIGMGVNYDPGNLDEHVPRHKVGVITDAWIDGKDVEVKGFIYKKDFPEAEKHLKNKKNLGMSMELANVYVRDENADVWYLLDFQFTGATILRKDAAAYYKTALAAKAAAQGEGATMKVKAKPTTKKREVAAGSAVPEIQGSELARAIATAVRGEMRPLVAELRASNERVNSLAEQVEELQHLTLQAAAGGEIEAGVEEEVGDEIEAAGEEEDGDEIEAAQDDPSDPSEEYEEEDPSDPSDVDAEAGDELEKLEEKAPYRKPGEINKGAKNKGNKTTTTEVGASMKVSSGKPLGGLKSSSIAAAAAIVRNANARVAKLQRKLDIQAAAHRKSLGKMQRTIDKMEAQMDTYAENESRRSAMPIDLTNLAAKANIDLNEIRATGTKMSVTQVDAMFAAAGIELDPVQRMTMKNRLLEAGVMEQGEVVR